MVALLKQKSKVTLHRKDRATYELADVFKKRKTNESSLADSQSQPQVPAPSKIGQSNAGLLKVADLANPKKEGKGKE